MDEHQFMKLCQMNSALVRVEAMKAEMMVAVSKGGYPPDYAGEMRWEADFIDNLYRN